VDPLTQGVLGAVAAQAISKKRKIVTAFAAGALGGMAADLDILIRSTEDPLLGLEFHRHFTHALSFIPIGGFIVAGLLWLVFSRQKGAFKGLYIFSTMGYATHGLLDSCTAYGTRLLWPFSDARISWDIIAIIDLGFTLPLLFLVVMSLIRKSPVWARVGCVWALAYLAFGAFERHRVEAIQTALAAKRGHTIERAKLNPSLGGLSTWRSVYQFDGKYYVDGIYQPAFGKARVAEGGAPVPVLNLNVLKEKLGEGSLQWRDVERFNYFAQGFIYQPQGELNFLSDLRYTRSSKIEQNAAMWGIELSYKPDEHVKHYHPRREGKRAYERIWKAMLKMEADNE
jgi:inner membrane protein